jgi:acetylornithine deacetylase/succinyl-diaminopimelate desuccinylase-like protein
MPADIYPNRVSDPNITSTQPRTDAESAVLDAVHPAELVALLRELYAGIGGIPTLHYGPGDVRHAHAPDEQVRIADLVTCCQALAVLAVRYCR